MEVDKKVKKNKYKFDKEKAAKGKANKAGNGKAYGKPNGKADGKFNKSPGKGYKPKHGDGKFAKSNNPGDKKRKRDENEPQEAQVEGSRGQQRKMQKRERMSERKYNDIVHEIKVIYNKLITRHGDDAPTKAEKHKLIDGGLLLLKGKMVELALKHDASRVIQSLLKFGHREHRNTVIEEMKDSIIALSMSKYAHFLVMKMLFYSTPEQQKAIIQQFLGHTVKLLSHVEAGQVVELAYTKYASKEQKNAMVLEFYGPEFALFKADYKDSNNLNVATILDSNPDKKPKIIKSLHQSLHKIVEKGLINFTLVHRLLDEYLSLIEIREYAEFIEMLKENAGGLLSTKDGVKVMLRMISYGTPKDRKVIVKNLKGSVLEMCHNDICSIVVTRLLDVVDDTVLLQKSILNEMFADLPSVCLSKAGRKPLLHVLAPRAARYFSREDLAQLQPPTYTDANGETVSTSKKEGESRRQELLVHLLPALLEVCHMNANAMVKSSHGSAVLIETLNQLPVGDEQATPILEVIADLTTREEAGEDELTDDMEVEQGQRTDLNEEEEDDEATTEPSGEKAKSESKLKLAQDDSKREADRASAAAWENVMQHYVAHRTLKSLVQRDAESAKTNGASVFAEMLLSRLEGTLMKWCGTKGVYVVLSLAEHPVTKAKVIAELKPHLKALQKLDQPGPKILVALVQGKAVAANGNSKEKEGAAAAGAAKTVSNGKQSAKLSTTKAAAQATPKTETKTRAASTKKTPKK
eukprot:GILJ01004936.1.p1 GENE.GILJ01004936.1~~GILJ01004936.1.p1  ORF type:complete len:750 (-),score=181.24 GILJ01004936.1:132-2381(-)